MKKLENNHSATNRKAVRIAGIIAKYDINWGRNLCGVNSGKYSWFWGRGEAWMKRRKQKFVPQISHWLIYSEGVNNFKKISHISGLVGQSNIERFIFFANLNHPLVAFPKMKLSILRKTEMGPEITEMTYYGPRDAYLGRGKLSLGADLGLRKLSKIFKGRIAHGIFAYSPDNLCNSRSYQPAERGKLPGVSEHFSAYQFSFKKFSTLTSADCFSSDSVLYITWNQWTAVIQLWSMLKLELWAHIAEKKWTIEKYLVFLLTGQRYSINSNFWVFVVTQVKTLIWFKFSKTFSRLVEWIFKSAAENLNFCCNSADFFENSSFSNTGNAVSLIILCVFITFWQRYHILMF